LTFKKSIFLELPSKHEKKFQIFQIFGKKKHLAITSMEEPLEEINEYSLYIGSGPCRFGNWLRGTGRNERYVFTLKTFPGTCIFGK